MIWPCVTHLNIFLHPMQKSPFDAGLTTTTRNVSKQYFTVLLLYSITAYLISLYACTCNALFVMQTNSESCKKSLSRSYLKAKQCDKKIK